MGAFREHFLDKYFGYRRRYVRAVADLAPHRRRLAVLSEIARLGFAFAASGLVLLIMGSVFVHMFGRAPWFYEGEVGAIALAASIFIWSSAAGLRAAWSDRDGDAALR